MQKIISLVVFIFALSWTWNVIHSSSAVGFETHSGIQEKLSEIIIATVQNKKPLAQNIQIDRLWTETINDNKVKAIFRYSFFEKNESGESLNQSIEGEVILHREPSETVVDQMPTEKWVLQSVKTTQDTVEFSEGTVITPGEEKTEEKVEEKSEPKTEQHESK